MRDDDIIQCECGSTHFTIARDGLIECAECKHPTDSLMARPARVREVLALRGVKITKPVHHLKLVG